MKKIIATLELSIFEHHDGSRTFETVSEGNLENFADIAEMLVASKDKNARAILTIDTISNFVKQKLKNEAMKKNTEK